MEVKTFSWKLRSIDSEDDTTTGEFSGLASVYDNIDLGGDSVKRGAFAKSIQSQGAGFPLLWQHRVSQPIGVGRISDAPNGLAMNGRLVMEDPLARRARAHMRAGSIRGLSIGYSPIKSTPRDDGGRDLHEVKLFEVSLVTLPMNESAQISGIKSLLPALAALTASDFEDDDELIGDLRSVDQYLRRLLPGAPPDPAIAAAAQLAQLKQLDAILRKALT